MSWLLDIRTAVWFTRDRRDVEAFLRARLPLAEWSIDPEPAIDARLLRSPRCRLAPCVAPPVPPLKSEAIALSLVFLRSMGEQFVWRD